MTFGKLDEVSSFGNRLSMFADDPMTHRYFIGGPLDGETMEVKNNDYYRHREFDPPETSAYTGTSIAPQEYIEVYTYEPRGFGFIDLRYTVMVLTTLSEEQALISFDMNRYKIQVDSHDEHEYDREIANKRRRYFMEHMIPMGPSGKIGSHQKKAVMMICYGAGVNQAVKQSGLSRRRVKVIMKRIKSYGGMLRGH